MCHLEEKWVMSGQVCPSFWYRYVEDTFTMFENKDTANGFLQYLNSRHNSIKFTIDFKQDNEIPFLDILVKRCPNNTFVTSVYRKKTSLARLHQMGFVYSAQVQNKSHTHSHLSLLPNLLLCFLAAICSGRSSKASASKRLPPRDNHLQC